MIEFYLYIPEEAVYNYYTKSMKHDHVQGCGNECVARVYRREHPMEPAVFGR
jgi:hypothetical protein